MKTKTENLDEDRVRLLVEIEPDEFDEAMDDAARRIGREVKIPGFRKGKVPRRVLENRLGRDVLREEAIRDRLPAILADAIESEGIDLVGTPKVERLDETETSPLVVEAVVDTRPVVEIEDWKGLAIEVPSPELDGEEIDKQIELIRKQSAPLETVARPAREGDFALVDLKAQIHGEDVDGTDLSDFSYEIGSESLVAKLDEELEGKRAGDILKFNAELPEHFGDAAGKEATFSVIVKEVRERKLPDLDDDWVDENTEFDTVDELRDDIEAKLSQIRRVSIAGLIREKTLAALAERVEATLSSAVVDEELDRLMDVLDSRLRRQGVTLDRYVAALGRDLDDIREEERKTAEDNVRADLALRAIARQEGIDADQPDIEEKLVEIAARSGRTVEQVRKAVDKARGWRALKADIIRSKSLELVISNAEIRDEAGDPVDWKALSPSGGEDVDVADGGGGGSGGESDD